jgi:hypothetical protein
VRDSKNSAGLLIVDMRGLVDAVKADRISQPS